MDPAELLRYAVERRASDVHLKAGNVPFIRVDGELLPTPFAELTPTDARQFADALMPPHKAEEFARTREADFAYTMEGVGRFRVLEPAFRAGGRLAPAVRLEQRTHPFLISLRSPLRGGPFRAENGGPVAC